MKKKTNDFLPSTFVPDAEIFVQNDKVSSLLKKFLMELDLGITKEILFNQRISDILKSNIYHFTFRKKKQLINCINKNCNLDINLDIRILHIHYEGTKYIFFESKKKYGIFISPKEFHDLLIRYAKKQQT